MNFSASSNDTAKEMLINISSVPDVLRIISIVLCSILTSLLLFSLAKGRMIFWKRPYYKLLVQLVVANVLAIAAKIVVVAYNESTVIQHSLEEMADQLNYTFLAVIAVQRLAVFVKQRLSELVFSRSRTKYVVITCWILLSALSIFLSMSDCYYHHTSTDRYEYSCNSISLHRSLLIRHMLTFQKTIYLLVIIVCYTIIFKRTRGCQSVRVDFGEKELLEQARLMTFLFQFGPFFKVVIYTRTFSAAFSSMAPALVSASDLLVRSIALLYILLSSKDLRRFVKIRTSTRLTLLNRPSS